VDDIINWLLRYVPQPVQGWILALARAIQAIINLILGAMFGAANAFMHQLQFVKGFLYWLGRHAEAVLNWARWLVLVKIPSIVDSLVSAMWTLSQQFLDHAVAFTRDLFNQVTRWAQSLFDWIWGQVQAFAAWVHDTVNQIIAVLSWVRDKVYELLTDPAKLAEWLAGAMLTALGRYVVANAGRLARWAWPRLLPAVVQSARTAESILTQIF